MLLVMIAGFTEDYFNRMKDRCESKCRMNCGDEDRNFMPDWIKDDTFRGKCIRACSKQFPNDAMGTQIMCLDQCHQVANKANMCVPAYLEGNAWENPRRHREKYGTEWCRFMSEVAIGPHDRSGEQYAKGFTYIPRHAPLTGVTRTHPWGQDMQEYLEEPYTDWLFPQCDTAVCPDAVPPIVSSGYPEDWTDFFNHFGQLCKDRSYGKSDEEQETKAEDCGGDCISWCEAACKCTWDSDAYRARTGVDGGVPRESRYQWSVDHNENGKGKLMFQCNRR